MLMMLMMMMMGAVFLKNGWLLPHSLGHPPLRSLRPSTHTVPSLIRHLLLLHLLRPPLLPPPPLSSISSSPPKPSAVFVPAPRRSLLRCRLRLIKSMENEYLVRYLVLPF